MLLSVVIITKNEAHIIGTTLQSLQGLTDDIVMVDSGSTDDTISIGKQFNARVIEMGWNGYGINKNVGIDAAQHDGILNIDADEALDEELKQALLQLSLTDNLVLYEMRFKNFSVVNGFVLGNGDLISIFAYSIESRCDGIQLLCMNHCNCHLAQGCN